MQFFTLDEVESRGSSIRSEVAPGVTMTRRRVLQGTLIGLTAASCRTARTGDAAQARTAQDLSLGQLVARLRPEALRMIASDRPNEALYLDEATDLLKRYAPGEPWFMREIGDTGWAMNAAARTPPVIVYDIEMQPGARIELHDHRHYSGVLYCTQGSVLCRQFDIVQPEGAPLNIAAGEVPPTGEDFLIRQTNATTLRPGDASTLARDRDNIHEVEAGEAGCTLVDLFTHFRPEARSYSIDWDGKPLSEGGDLYRVSWQA